MAIGFRVFTKRLLPSQQVVEAFRALATAPVADCMGRLSAMHHSIRRMSPKGPMLLGTALTVKARSGDNLMIHKALNMATEHDVIVVANEGDMAHAVMGEVMFSYAAFKKIPGMVTNGPIRDAESLEDLGVIVYAAGVTPAGPYNDGPGEINVPRSCGGIAVNPGDIIMGDSDGLIVIPAQDAEALLAEAVAFTAADTAKTEAAKKGTADRSWVDKSLQSKNCEVLERQWNQV